MKVKPGSKSAHKNPSSTPDSPPPAPAFGVKPDWWIREQAKAGMIEPFEERLVRKGVISYGLSSFGYDLRAASEWKIFTNVFNTVVDPKQFDPRSFVEYEGDEVIIPPNSFVLARSIEYIRMPEDTLAIAVGKSTYARCFSGDTRVALADGSAPALEEMARRAERGEMFFGYSVGPLGRIIVTLLESPRFIGRDSLLEIELDNGEGIRATPDHLFMLRDGQMAAACELRPGISLMPLYRQVARGYEMTYQPLNGHLYPTHRLADEWNLRNGIYPEQPGTHRHHKDEDRRNNNPWNIERMDASAHIRLHNHKTYGEGFDPEAHGLSVREAYERLRNDDERYRAYRQDQSRKARQFWNSETYAEARARLLAKKHDWSEEQHLNQSNLLKKAYRDNPELRSRIGELSRAAWAADDGQRREAQRVIAQKMRIREEITAEVVRKALDETGSIRGAARLLECDRAVFRRFPEVIRTFKGLSDRVNHKVVAIRELPGEHDVYCLSVPEAGNFALEAGVFVHNCGIVANVTPIEPGWEGHVTLEFSNTTPLPAKMYANEGCVQLVFFQGERPEVTYKDRKGKYQGQKGITLPRI